jgi:glucosamine--fructose-6-phosphate aminotransferase (isomerizing)
MKSSKDNGGKIIKGAFTFSEISYQADAWEGVFQRIDEKAHSFKKMFSRAEEILVAGCGSAFNVSYAVAPVLQKLTRKTCRAVHSSDLVINRDSFMNNKRNTLAVVYSRSGNTTESVQALKEAQKAGAQTLAVVCFAQSRMAETADFSLVLEEASENSVTTTRSLTSMVLAGRYLGATCTENKRFIDGLKNLPAIARSRMDEFHEIGKKVGRDGQIQKFAFVGSGGFYGLAREAQLKIKEMVLLPSDSYVSLDFQHGPMSNVDEHMLVVILVSDAGRRLDFELAGNMKKLGGRIFVLCDKADDGFRKTADYLVELNTDLQDGVRDILYMPALQYMAYYKSLEVGSDPDNPKNLFYHVEVKGIEY